MPLIVVAPRLKAVADRFEAAGVDVHIAAADGVEAGTYRMEAAVKQNLQGDPVAMRTGRLHASVASYVDRQRLLGVTGTPTPYARTIEHGTEGLPGGAITPRLSKVLTIPLDAAKTASGKPRGTAREVGAKYEDTFWARTGRGNLILFGVEVRIRQGRRDDRITALFLGVESVEIEARRPFGLAMEANEAAVIEDINRRVGEKLPRDP